MRSINGEGGRALHWVRTRQGGTGNGVPSESLKDDTMLFRAMELSLEMHGVESALQHAKALLRRTGISADMRAKAADIVVQADPAKAVAFLRELADASPLLNISIYEASKLAGGEGGKAGGGDAALHAFCGPLIQRMQEPVQDGNTYSREYALDMYKAGISILQQKGFHGEVLALSSWLDEVPGVDSSDKYWVVQAIKGRSLEALGRVEEAKATYRRVIDTDAFSPRGKTMARNYMKNIGKKKPVPLPHENDRAYQ